MPHRDTATALIDERDERDARDDEADVPVVPPLDDSDDRGGGDDDVDEGDGDGGEGGDDRGGPWVTVGMYWQSAEAQMARLKLETEQIPCVILDENAVSVNWLWANALGGIKLQVPADLAGRARELLQAPRPESDEPMFDGEARCPRCGSDQLFPVRLSRKLAMLSILLLGAPLPFLYRKTRCAGCGFEF